MLQAALLLLGCALSRYLWEINIVIASVVIGVTSVGVLFYLLIVVAGTVSKNCPYQTPAADFLRSILLHHIPRLRSAPSVTFAFVSFKCSQITKSSRFCSACITWWSLMKRPWYSVSNMVYTLIYYLIAPPLTLIIDGYRLVRVVIRSLIALGGAAHRRFNATPFPRPSYSLEQRRIAADLRCISWILQTSLDRAVHLSTFKLLVSMQELSHLDPILVADCLGVFIGCVNVSNGKVMIMQGLEQLATASANGLFLTFHHLMVMDPTSSILADLHRRYNKVFPAKVDFTGLPFYSTMTMAHALVNRFGNPRYVWWDNHRLPGHKHIPFSRRVLEAAQAEFRRTKKYLVGRSAPPSISCLWTPCHQLLLSQIA